MPPYKILYITPSVRLFGARVSLLTLVTNLDKNQFEQLKKLDWFCKKYYDTTIDDYHNDRINK